MKENQLEEWFEDMGWHFNQDDDFVDKNGNMFDFKTQSDYYEFVHDKIQVILHERLVQEYGLVRVPIPWDPSHTRSQGGGPIPSDCPRVFVSNDVMVNPKVLLIVQGLGKVAPGQWARKLFTNGRKGEFPYASQFPYIQRALHLGWAVILCDPNRTELSPSPAPSSGLMGWLRPRGGTRSDHVRRVWEDLIRHSLAKCVMIVAFSAGTWATLDLFDTNRIEFKRRVKAVALLDGSTGGKRYWQRDGDWLFKNTWTFSQMGAGESENGEEVNTDDHDSVPGVAVGRVFEFLEERHNLFIAKLPDDEFGLFRGLYRRIVGGIRGRGVGGQQQQLRIHQNRRR
ncbi:MAG: hypothetical protein J3R72DRAFT_479707 [Linnemannia gamsii]|nr:MAG: hypothetical protein J3R72DRAFT_479707 [Linnemannia gamsii]